MGQPGPHKAVLTTRIDRNGLATTLQWDDLGRRLLAMEGPGGRQRLTLTWPQGYPGPTRIQDHTGRILVKNTYEARHAGGRKSMVLAKVENAGGRVVEYGYRTLARNGQVVHNLLTTRINGVLQKKQVQADPFSGEMLEITRRSGETTRVERYFAAPDGETPGWLQAHTIRTGPQVPGGRQEWISDFDTQGRVSRQTDPLEGETRYAYRTEGDPEECGCGTQPKKIIDELGHETTLTYDQRQNLTSLRNSLGQLVELTWVDDNLTQVKTSQGTTVLGYDSHSNLNSVTDPLGHTQTLTYNSLGKVESVRDNLGHETTLSYDASGFLTGRSLPPATPGGVRAEWTYTVDALGRRRVSRDPLGREVRYHYDEADYDDANRLTGLACVATGDEVGFSYDDLNRVATMTDASGTTTYTYTLNSLLQSVTRPGNRTLTYGYDLADRLKTLTDPEGLVTNYTYNDRDELTDVSLDSQTVHYEHDLVGRPTVTSYPNGMMLADSFDERDRLLTRTYRKGGSPLLTLNYAYSQLGQRVLSEQITGRGTDRRSYSYTDRRELESSERTVIEAGGSGDQGSGKGKHCKPRARTTRRVYKFDDNQNRTQAGNITASLNGADQLTATSDGQSYSHSGQGQMTEARPWSFTYNHADQVKTAAKTGVNATYLYDGNGLRVQKRVSSSSGSEATDYLWAGPEVVKEYTGMGAAKATYLLGARREGIKTDQGWQFYLRDALGSTVMTTDASGEIASQFEYGDWGETTQVFGSADLYNPYRYTGQQFDGETGLYYLRARSYAPGLGRFTSRDPIGYAGGMNLYSYCGGDPINFLDPLGLELTPTELQLLDAARNALGVFGGIIGTVIGGAGGGAGGGLVGSGAGPVGTVAGTSVGMSQGAASGGAMGTAGGLLLGEIIKQTIITGSNAFAEKPGSTSGGGGGGGDAPKFKVRNGKPLEELPSWVQEAPLVGESSQTFATRLLNAKYGEGNWKKGGGTEFNKIVKTITRGYCDP